MINLFQVYYDSGQTIEDCLKHGSTAIDQVLYGYIRKELEKHASYLGITARDRQSVYLQDIINDHIMQLVIASQGRAFRDY